MSTVPTAGVDVGIAMGPVPPFDAMRRRAARLVEAGFSSLWWPDHLVAFHSRETWSTGALSAVQPDPHTYADPFVCMAACAEAAAPAIIGVCVTDGIRRLPATLVQAAMSLDHLAPGRVVLGLGSGEWANYGPYGWSVDSPAQRLEEAARQVRALLDAHEDAAASGAVMGLRPAPGSAGPRLWLAAHGPRSFATTGRYADGWIPNFLAVDAWHEGRRAVQTAAERAGRDPDSITIGLSCQVVIQETHEAAERLLDHPILKAFCLLLPPDRFAAAGVEHPLGGGGLRHMVASQDGARQLEAARAVPVQVATSYFLHGTVDEVETRLREYEGVDHVILWDPVPLADLGAARASTKGTAELARRLHGLQVD